MTRPVVVDEAMDRRAILGLEVTGPGLVDRLLTNLPAHYFPRILGSEVTDNAASTSHDIAIPVDVRLEGLILVVIATEDVPAITWPAEYTPVSGFLTGNTTVQLDAAWKLADGTEGGIPITVTLGASKVLAAIAYSIVGWDAARPPEGATALTGSGNKSNPPNLDPASGGREDYLFIAVDAHDATFGYNSFPVAYEDIVQNVASTTYLATGKRELFATSEDPTEFNFAGVADFIANTLVVYPGAYGTNFPFGADPLGYSVSLQDAALAHGFLFPADPLAYTVALSDASILAARLIKADPLSFSLALSDATLLRAALQKADPLAYSVSLSDAALAHGYVLVVDPLAFVVSLQAAQVLVGRALAADPLAYTVSLSAATLQAARILSADPLTYALSLQAATLLRDAILKADPLVFGVSLQNATTLRAALLAANPLAFQVALSDATLEVLASNVLAADPLVISVSLADAGLIYTPLAGGAGGYTELLRRRRR